MHWMLAPVVVVVVTRKLIRISHKTCNYFCHMKPIGIDQQYTVSTYNKNEKKKFTCKPFFFLNNQFTCKPKPII